MEHGNHGNRQCLLAARPVGLIKESDFGWRQTPVPVPAQGQILVHNLYLSLDPAMRGWLSDQPSYIPPGGAIGSLVGQLGKLKGCRVIGIAGSAAKCAWIRDELGFDVAINYKTEPVFERLREVCPHGIDIHYENVGIPFLEAALRLINLRGRIVLCGMIAHYNATELPPGPASLANLIVQRARMEGFIVSDYFPRIDEALADLMRWYAEGRLAYHVEVVEGLEQAPHTINKLFDGSNTGKLIIKI